MAAAGLNWVRIPVPFWAIDSREGEPFLPNVSWKCAFLAASTSLSHEHLLTSSTGHRLHQGPRLGKKVRLAR